MSSRVGSPLTWQGVPADTLAAVPFRGKRAPGRKQVVAVQPLTPSDPKRVGPFRLHRRIGPGRLGPIYLGRDRGGRVAAVQVVGDEYAADPHFRAGFPAALAAASQVAGRSVAAPRIWDADSPQPWFATDDIDGPTLGEYVTAHGPLASHLLAPFAACVADALAAMHAVGLPHGNLRPSDVVLAADGPKVRDFAIAPADGSSAGDASGDILALGMLIAYAATGHAPFRTGRPDETARSIAEDEPDLGGIPGDLQALVAATLARDPAERPAATDVLEFLRPADATTENPAQIAELLRSTWDPRLVLFTQSGAGPTDSGQSGMTGAAGAPNPRRRRAFAITAAVVAAVLVGAGGGYAGVKLVGDDDSGDKPSNPATSAGPSNPADSTPPPTSASPGATGTPSTSPSSSTSPRSITPPSAASTGSATGSAPGAPATTATLQGITVPVPSGWHAASADVNILCVAPVAFATTNGDECADAAVEIRLPDDPAKRPDFASRPDPVPNFTEAVGFGWYGQAHCRDVPDRTFNGGTVPMYVAGSQTVLDEGFRPIGSRTAEYRAWRAGCDNGAAFYPRLWWLPETKLSVRTMGLDRRYEAEVDTMLRGVTFS